MPVGAIAGIAGNVLGSVVGNIASSGDRDRAARAMQEAMAHIQSLNVPVHLAGPIILDKFQRAGILTPELEQQINQGVSKVSQIQEDPMMREAQLSALSGLKQVSQSGLRPEDRAALSQIRQQAQRDNQAKQQQILQNMQSRGIAGSGNELAAQLAASQSAAESQERAGMDISSQASQRALQALRDSGGLAGNIREQDFGVESVKAGAEDELNRFNIQNQRDVQYRNVSAKNAAQAANLGALQNASDMNVGAQNQEYAAQRNRAADVYGMQANKAGMMSDMLSSKAKQSQDEAARKQQSWSSIGSTAGQIAGGLLGGGGSISERDGELDLAEGETKATYSADKKFGPANYSAGMYPSRR